MIVFTLVVPTLLPIELISLLENYNNNTLPTYHVFVLERDQTVYRSIPLAQHAKMYTAIIKSCRILSVWSSEYFETLDIKLNVEKTCQQLNLKLERFSIVYFKRVL